MAEVPTPTPTTEPTPEEPQVSVEQFNALATTVNGLSTGIGTINETLKGLQPAPASPPEPTPEPTPKGGEGEVQAVKTELADLKTKYETSEKERQDLLAQQADDARKASIKELAKAGGVNDEALDAFVGAKGGLFKMTDGQLTIVDAAGNPAMSATEAGQQIKGKEFFEGLAKKEAFWFGQKQVVPDNANPLRNLMGGNQDSPGDVQIVTVEEMRQLRATEPGRKAILSGKVRVAEQSLQQTQ